MALPILTGLRAHYEASSASEDSWRDIVGSVDLYPRKGSSVRVIAGALNSHPVVRIDGGEFAPNNFNLPQPFTVVMVVDVRARDVHPYYATSPRLWGTSGQYGARLTPVSKVQKPKIQVDLGSRQVAATSFALESAQVLSFVVDTDVVLRQNGIETAMSGTAGDMAITDLVFGSPEFHGDIAEIAVYSTAVDSPDLDVIEAYLFSKYDIASGTFRPVAYAGPDQSFDLPSTAILDGTGSSDPQSSPLSYAWTPLYPKNVHIANPTTSVATMDTGNRGVTYVKLEVTNAAGYSDNDYVVIDVVEPYVSPPPINVPTEARGMMYAQAIVLGKGTVLAHLTQDGASHLSSSASLAVDMIREISGTSAFGATSSVTAVGQDEVLGQGHIGTTASLDGSARLIGTFKGSISAMASMMGVATADLGGVGTLAATSTAYALANAVRMEASLVATATQGADASLNMSAILDASGASGILASAGVDRASSLTAISTAEASGNPAWILGGAVALTSNAQVYAEVSTVAESTAVITATATADVLGGVNYYAMHAMHASAECTGDVTVARSGSSNLLVSATSTLSGEIDRTASVSMAASSSSSATSVINKTASSAVNATATVFVDSDVTSTNPVAKILATEPAHFWWFGGLEYGGEETMRDMNGDPIEDGSTDVYAVRDLVTGWGTAMEDLDGGGHVFANNRVGGGGEMGADVSVADASWVIVARRKVGNVDGYGILGRNVAVDQTGVIASFEFSGVKLTMDQATAINRPGVDPYAEIAYYRWRDDGDARWGLPMDGLDTPIAISQSSGPASISNVWLRGDQALQEVLCFILYDDGERVGELLDEGLNDLIEELKAYIP